LSRLGRAHIPRSALGLPELRAAAARRYGEPALTPRPELYNTHDDSLNGGRSGAPADLYGTIPRPASPPAQVCCANACACVVCCCCAVSLVVACDEAMCVCVCACERRWQRSPLPVWLTLPWSTIAIRLMWLCMCVCACACNHACIAVAHSRVLNFVLTSTCSFSWLALLLICTHPDGTGGVSAAGIHTSNSGWGCPPGASSSDTRTLCMCACVCVCVCDICMCGMCVCLCI